MPIAGAIGEAGQNFVSAQADVSIANVKLRAAGATKPAPRRPRPFGFARYADACFAALVGSQDVVRPSSLRLAFIRISRKRAPLGLCRGSRVRGALCDGLPKRLGDRAAGAWLRPRPLRGGADA